MNSNHTWHNRVASNFNPVVASLDERHYVERRQDGMFVASLDHGAEYVRDEEGGFMLFGTVDAAKAAIEAILDERPPAPPQQTHSAKTKPPEPAFKEFVTEQQLRDSAEASQVDQRAAASAIIAEDAAEFARNTRPEGHLGPNVAELVGSVIKYLDYQRAELTIRKPEGESGDIVWLINKTLANAGVSPERALISAVQTLAYYMVDLYGQNAKIRRRLTELEGQAAASEEERMELVDCVAQLQQELQELNPGWAGVDFPPRLSARIEQAMKEAEQAETNGKGTNESN